MKNLALSSYTSGFLRSVQVIVDDTIPATATAVNAEDGWNWGQYFYAPSGAQPRDHLSQYLTRTHKHYYRDDTNGFSMSSGRYHIQYVYIPSGVAPAEIMLEFEDNTGSWEHRAYWGQNSIALGTDGTASRFFMGNSVPQQGRWVMLIVKSDDVGTATTSPIKGLAYTLYGGQAAWDFSAEGDIDTGRVWMGGLSQGWTIQLYDTKDIFVTSGVVPAGQTAQYLDLYGSSRRINVFPFDGYFVLKDSSQTAVYRSPVLSLWGGDYYTYSATSFYANAGIETATHDRLAGALEYQTGRFAQPLVQQEMYVRYTPQGLPDRTKVRDASVWRETAYAYDGTYGLVTSVTDPAISRHLNVFLESAGQVPDAILFNGGVFKAEMLQDRLLHIRLIDQHRILLREIFNAPHAIITANTSMMARYFGIKYHDITARIASNNHNRFLEGEGLSSQRSCEKSHCSRSRRALPCGRQAALTRRGPRSSRHPLRSHTGV